MKLSVWLRALLAILGLVNARPGPIEEVNRAAAAVEVVEAMIGESKQKL